MFPVVNKSLERNKLVIFLIFIRKYFIYFYEISYQVGTVFVVRFPDSATVLKILEMVQRSSCHGSTRKAQVKTCCASWLGRFGQSAPKSCLLWSISMGYELRKARVKCNWNRYNTRHIVDFEGKMVCCPRSAQPTKFKHSSNKWYVSEVFLPYMSYLWELV